MWPVNHSSSSSSVTWEAAVSLNIISQTSVWGWTSNLGDVFTLTDGRLRQRASRNVKRETWPRALRFAWSPIREAPAAVSWKNKERREEEDAEETRREGERKGEERR